MLHLLYNFLGWCVLSKCFVTAKGAQLIPARVGAGEAVVRGEVDESSGGLILSCGCCVLDVRRRKAVILPRYFLSYPHGSLKFGPPPPAPLLLPPLSCSCFLLALGFHNALTIRNCGLEAITAPTSKARHVHPAHRLTRAQNLVARFLRQAAFVRAPFNPRASRQQHQSRRYSWVPAGAGRRQRAAVAASAATTRAVRMVATDPGLATASTEQEQRQPTSGKEGGAPPLARVNAEPSRHDKGVWAGGGESGGG